MFQTNHRFPIRFFMALLLATLCLLFPLIALGSDNQVDESAGIYEGEYDADGKRSGQGSWVYHNYLYVGQWENDMPNGKGTLYEHEIGHIDGRDELRKCVISGTWADGLAEGAIEETDIAPASNRIYRYDVAAGCSIKDEEVPCINYTGAIKMVSANSVIGIVPPWHFDWPQPDLPTPLANDEYDAAAVEWNAQRRQETADATAPEALPDGAVYDGEYDENGKRSGQGTLSYYNYLYVGEWKYDKPNGDGVLYKNLPVINVGVAQMILRGSWVDGRAEGTAELTWFDPFRGDVPRIFQVNGMEHGGVRNDEQFVCLNAAASPPWEIGYVFAWVEPFSGFDDITVDHTVGTPWELYEQFPTGKVPYVPYQNPIEKIQNTGMGVSSGNLTNQSLRQGIARLGDWIFIADQTTNKKGTEYTIYKMRLDGTQVTKLMAFDSLDVHFQAIGDWLFVGQGDMDFYLIQADDMEMLTIENAYFFPFVLDDWQYDVQADWMLESQTSEHTPHSIVKTKLDDSEKITLGSYVIDKRITHNYGDYLDRILYADQEWVYVFNTDDFGISQGNNVVSQLVKVKNDDSGTVETYNLSKEASSARVAGGLAQVHDGNVYYLEAWDNKAAGRTETRLYSVDVDFQEEPAIIIPRSEEAHFTAFHVTDDFIYYGLVTNSTGQGAIMRANHDGSNAVVLVDELATGHSKMSNGFDTTGELGNILIAGDWMMFRVQPENGGASTWYLMRLDGTDLHKVGEPFIPSNAPGITDSTGKWRYEVLSDGSAKLLGAGSKLKFTGKLAIPATVDKIPVTAIGENAFYGYDAFTGVTIPKSVTEIGDFAFFWCKGLTSATIPEGVARIGEGAFQYCEKLKKLDLPASLLSVGSESFANCPDVKLSVAKKNEVFQVVDGIWVEK